MKRKQHKQQRKRGAGAGVRIPKQVNSVQLSRFTRVTPNEDYRLLDWTYASSYAGGAATYKTIRFIPNGAYDVDPTVGSTSTAGFAEFAALYSNYRVVHYKYMVSVTNKEAFPNLLVLTNTDSDLGTGTSLGAYAGNDKTQSCVLGPALSGKCQKVFHGSHKVADITGSPTVETDDTYSALVTANPADKVYLGIGQDGLGSALGNGAAIFVRITMAVRFYGRKALTS